MFDVVPAVPALGSADQDVPMPTVSDRVAALAAQMTLEEKLAQLVGYWLDQNGTVAPMQSEMTAGQADGGLLPEITKHGLGHYTRVYGTRPVDPVEDSSRASCTSSLPCRVSTATATRRPSATGSTT